MFTLDVVATEFAALVVNFQIRQLFQAFQHFLYDVNVRAWIAVGVLEDREAKKFWWNREA